MPKRRINPAHIRPTQDKKQISLPKYVYALFAVETKMKHATVKLDLIVWKLSDL